VTTIRHTIRDAILTCARKPTRVSLIYRTEPTTKKCKTEKVKTDNYVGPTVQKHATLTFKQMQAYRETNEKANDECYIICYQ